LPKGETWFVHGKKRRAEFADAGGNVEADLVEPINIPPRRTPSHSIDALAVEKDSVRHIAHRKNEVKQHGHPERSAVEGSRGITSNA
jgi:hypothetical protein